MILLILLFTGGEYNIKLPQLLMKFGVLFMLSSVSFDNLQPFPEVATRDQMKPCGFLWV